LNGPGILARAVKTAILLEGPVSETKTGGCVGWKA
jgi:hypothetical protein